MVSEVVGMLRPRPGMVVVDCTVGAGGHAEALLRAAGGRVTFIGIDRDPAALDWAAHRLARFGDSVRLVAAGFDDLEWILRSQGVPAADAILLDLGMSSMQVDDASRGFSYRRDGPLDMRMDPTSGPTAQDVVNVYSAEELERIILEYGEERYAGLVARAITTARRRAPLRTTTELAGVIQDAYPPRARRGTHPARRTFQALRIEVNDELGALDRTLRAAPDALASGGRIAVLSYHSLEDRLTKRIFDELAPRQAPLPGLPPPESPNARLRPLARGALLPGRDEVERNPRARSARLRGAEKLS
jgi:16S rRNA (cytosine1402-N4)-methyltransferase